MGVTKDDMAKVAGAIGYTVPDEDVDEYITLLQKTKETFEAIDAMDDYYPVPDFTITPRNNVHFPAKNENPLNAWAWRCECTSSAHTSDLLKGKTVCLKDNIAFAGVPCLLGTDSFTDWTPQVDATVATRILAAGGTISGKAVCENLSRGAVSVSAATGPVDNPYAKGYSAGGSSSGTGAIVGSGAADMGLGCDQGGSIRIPAADCGLYGFKATLGLVPYTGIASNDAAVDFVGPMTRTCMECAELLQAIAGVDDLDDRQLAGTPFVKDVPRYSEIIRDTKPTGIKGLRIGILKEGLDNPAMDSELAKKFRAAVNQFEKLGAEVSEVSVPMHHQARAIYSVTAKMANHMGMLGQATGRRQLMMTDLFEKKNTPYSQDALSKMSAFSREGLFSGQFGWDNYPCAYPKAVNLTRKLKHLYDEALQQVDIIVLPTTLVPAEPLPDLTAKPTIQMAANRGKTENTCSFNSTGHPALAMPIGFIPSKADPNIKVPASLQIVGRFWDETTILKAAYAWECSADWKEF